MTRKCKVCKSDLLIEIDRQIKKGCNFNYLSQWCLERDFKITPNALKNHALTHIEGHQVLKDIQDRQAMNNVKEDLKIIAFEDYCDAIGLKPEYFEDLENNFDKIIYGSQKALTLVFFKASAVVNQKLDQHLSEYSAYPNEQIKGLRNIYEIYSKVTGLEKVVDENVAIKTLESRGYTISKGYIDIDVETE